LLVGSSGHGRAVRVCQRGQTAGLSVSGRLRIAFVDARWSEQGVRPQVLGNLGTTRLSRFLRFKPF
jgi:hypothetical protein